MKKAWEGGENPVPGKTVEVWARDGVSKIGKSEFWWWGRDKDAPDNSDIVAYRVIEDEK